MRVGVRSLGIGLPSALLLVVAFVCFAGLADRGFETTDEAFYLLHLQHWRQTDAAVGFFGLYFEWLLRAVDGDVALVRVAGWLVLVGAAACATVEVLAYCARGVPASRWPYAVAGAASALTYYCYLTTLRVPSYNLAALVFALLATAALLRARRLPVDKGGLPWAVLPVVYGAAIAACTISKPTAGLLLVPLHLAFLLATGWGWRFTGLGKFFVWSLLGAGVSLFGLQVANPSWTKVVGNGLSMLAAYGSHGDGVGSMAHLLAWQIKSMLASGAPAAGALALVCLSISWVARRWRVSGLGVVEVVAVGAVVWFILGISDREGWWLLAVVALGAMLIRLTVCVDPDEMVLAPQARQMLPCLAMLMCTPFALSFGTNNSIAIHASINAVFAGMALVACLCALRASGRLGGPGAAVALATLAVPGVFTQWRASVDVESTFRLTSPLSAQVHRVSVGLGAHELLVDEKMRASLGGLYDTARAAGWKPGATMLDLTGDGPGWVYALGATPLGVPWLLGGYPGSSAAASQLVTRAGADRLREAWLLTSDDNPRRIGDWSSILQSKLGKDSHIEVGTFRVHSTYRAPREPRDTWTLRLWRPASKTGATATSTGSAEAKP